MMIAIVNIKPKTANQIDINDSNNTIVMPEKVMAAVIKIENKFIGG